MLQKDDGRRNMQWKVTYVFAFKMSYVIRRMTSHHLCHILSEASKGPAHIQEEGITQRCEHPEAGIIERRPP